MMWKSGIRHSSSVIPDLLDFIPAVSPELVSPTHLKDAADLLQAYRTNPFEFVFSVPPRHGKTVLILHFIVWALLHDPTLKVMYITYAQSQAEDMQADGLKIAAAAGLLLSRATRSQWETPQGGKVVWSGIQGALTGKGCNIAIIDDPVKNRVEAESGLMRDRTWAAFSSDVFSRLQSGGSPRIEPSICIIQTRWHDDDLAGRLSKGDIQEERPGWHTINHPAIIEEPDGTERALWEDVRPLKHLLRVRSTTDSYTWASLYMGRPQPKGMSIFGDPTFFSEEPRNFKSAHGLDLAYTSKKASDYSVIVTMLREAGADKFYVVRVHRQRVAAPEFKKTIRIARSEYAGPIRIYAAGTEIGTTDFFRVAPDPVNVQVMAPIGDKHTRAIPFAAAWGAEKVMVPSPELVAAHPDKYAWVNDYLSELKSFTGLKDLRDDQVDASDAAYDQLGGPPAKYEGFGSGQKPPGRRM